MKEFFTKNNIIKIAFEAVIVSVKFVFKALLNYLETRGYITIKIDPDNMVFR